LRGRKGKAKEEKRREGREGGKEGKPFLCLGVKKPTRKGKKRAYVIILLFYPFFSSENQ